MEASIILFKELSRYVWRVWEDTSCKKTSPGNS